MNGHDITNTLARCGIPKTVGAHLFGVSRQTLYTWAKGVKPLNKFIYRRATKITHYLQVALETGALPLTNPPSDPKRYADAILDRIIPDHENV